jgi:hypothetical protein
LEHHHGSRAGFEDTFKMNLSVCRFDDGWREIGFAQAIGKVCLCRIVRWDEKVDPRSRMALSYR